MKTIFYTALCLFALASCTTSKVRVETTLDERVSLAYNRTYSILKSSGLQGFDEENQQIIVDEIERQMRARGYTYQEEKGDLSVLFSVYSDAFRLKQTDPAYSASKLKKGTLLIHLVDETLNRSVWMGYASGLFEKTQAIPESQVRSATRRIMDQYPALAYGYVPMKMAQQ
ncbi:MULTISPECIES: DUF4136 domain-containing protein [unclassified Siphonobacter]|uniref:DUF4136 domain-containing protein n=1 Tax=unclassified Siphonobacter TaxID=2635712 RepID=UPI002786837E|nr:MULTISPECIES: DUF4136 domain-containing protein [unclassified Siphonobacter]MDQ1088039.1 hypothetical protein [Siphonobacter sp. SORGH_AS_1065]MDR6194190.1 hypothetical protein [Siphonobacter sp. SORGH_AS_0500]